MKFTRLILLMSLFFLAIPLTAQEDTGTCDIDLIHAILALTEAQQAANSDDDDTALSVIDEVNNQLSELIAACENSDAIVEAQPVLPELFIAPNEMMSFRYPEGWVSEVFDSAADSGIYVTANSVDSLEVFAGDPSDVLPGQQGIGIIFGSPNTPLFDNADSPTLDGITTDLSEQLDDGTIVSMTAIQQRSFNDRQARQFTARGTNYGLKVIVIDYLNQNQLAVLISVSSRDDFEATTEIMDQIAESIRVPAEEPEPISRSSEISTETVVINELWQNAEVVSTQELSDFLDAGDIREARISPDGTKIATVVDDQMCIYREAFEASNCFTFPERPSIVDVSWSPSSRYLTFTQNFFIFLLEPDIWIFDTETAVFSNLTLDGQDRIDLSESDNYNTVDVVPTWHPDGSIYFIRLDLAQEDYMALYRVTVDGELTLVRDLTGELPPRSIYNSQIIQLNGAMVISPDGNTIAMSVRDLSNMDDVNNGIWILETSGEEPPQQIKPMSQFSAGLRQELQDNGVFTFPDGLAWTTDGQGLFIIGIQPQYLEASAIPYFIDLTDNVLTPLIDFTEISREEFANENDPETGVAYSALIPRASVVPSGSDRLFTFGMSQDRVGYLYSIDMAGNINVLTEIEDVEFARHNVSTASRDGTLLIAGYGFELSD